MQHTNRFPDIQFATCDILIASRVFYTIILIVSRKIHFLVGSIGQCFPCILFNSYIKEFKNKTFILHFFGFLGFKAFLVESIINQKNQKEFYRINYITIINEHETIC